MATTSIRTAVARRFIELLQADGDLTGATVTYGYPRENAALGSDLCVFVQIAEDGGQTVTHMKAGRKTRDDVWDLDVWVALHVTGDIDGGLEACETVEAAFAAVENLCAANPTLQQDGEGISGLNWAVLAGDLDGPRATPTETGHVAWINARVQCRARLS